MVYIVHLYGEWPEVEADRYVVGADGPDALLRVLVRSRKSYFQPQNNRACNCYNRVTNN